MSNPAQARKKKFDAPFALSLVLMASLRAAYGAS